MHHFFIPPDWIRGDRITFDDPVAHQLRSVLRMQPGSVIVDLAAERGGNCELTKAGETVVENGVTILGPVNLPAEVPYHGSQMYSKNVTNFLQHLVKNGAAQLDADDQIIRETMLCRDGRIVHAGLVGT